MTLPAALALNGSEVQTEACGCIYDPATGELVLGCRRHDPVVASRIVAQLEEQIRVAWTIDRTLSRRMEADPTLLIIENWLANRGVLRVLFRIRRAGR